MVRDFAEAAFSMILRHEVTQGQEAIYRKMMVRAPADPEAFSKVWDEVLPIADAYRQRG